MLSQGRIIIILMIISGRPCCFEYLKKSCGLMLLNLTVMYIIIRRLNHSFSGYIHYKELKIHVLFIAEGIKNVLHSMMSVGNRCADAIDYL